MVSVLAWSSKNTNQNGIVNLSAETNIIEKALPCSRLWIAKVNDLQYEQKYLFKIKMNSLLGYL